MPDLGALNLSASFLFASLIWGSIGAGFAIYGKKQRSALALGCGLAMVAISYFVSSAVLMSLACVGIIVAMYLLKRQGWD
jgi:glucose dehydrogenase